MYCFFFSSSFSTSNLFCLSFFCNIETIWWRRKNKRTIETEWNCVRENRKSGKRWEKNRIRKWHCKMMVGKVEFWRRDNNHISLYTYYLIFKKPHKIKSCLMTTSCTQTHTHNIHIEIGFYVRTYVQFRCFYNVRKWFVRMCDDLKISLCWFVRFRQI